VLTRLLFRFLPFLLVYDDFQPSPSRAGRFVNRVLVASGHGQMEDSYVKVAKLLGSLTWHSHAQEDELFFVLKGHLRLEYW
jgi:mannose-6-phosphate isomerase-like protein (cupin superfamily)